ncbi:hypothetical protein ACJVC5_14530 [Peredibacter sp. HCB2-198]|uniref:hypothetical protein n=1 Tax=Peredibacter sp. HCB2-198 TaxID=3383025 RepID=UPI0038B443F2
MKKYLVAVTLLASMSAFADPILDCDKRALDTALEISPVAHITEASVESDLEVYMVELEGKTAVLSFDRDCDFWDMEISEQ